MAIAAVRTCDVFWIPFKSDCEELLRRFQQTGSVRYVDFVALWKAMDFSSVFYGITINHEKRPFIRLTFTTAYDYFLPPFSFQIRVGALYMLYGLYFTQPVSLKEKISIALKDWVCVQTFLSDAVSCQHLDVVYVYKKLLSEKAFAYAAMPNQLVFDAKHRFRNKNINEFFQDQSARVTELVNAATLEEITNVQAHYERIKQVLEVSSSVNVRPVNLSRHLQECALEFQQWQENIKKQKNENSGAKAQESTQTTECSTRADLVATIKSKSYMHLAKASKSRRHRQMEMDTSGSGTDHAQEVWSPQKKRQLSLRERTWQSLGKKVSEEERHKHWVLSSKEEDKVALKQCKQKNRFRW